MVRMLYWRKEELMGNRLKKGWLSGKGTGVDAKFAPEGGGVPRMDPPGMGGIQNQGFSDRFRLEISSAIVLLLALLIFPTGCIVENRVFFPDLNTSGKMVDSDETRNILNPAIFTRLAKCDMIDAENVVGWMGFNEGLGNTYDDYVFYKEDEVKHCARFIVSAPCESNILAEVNLICNLQHYRGSFFFQK